MRILVTGGRTYSDAACVAALLDRALRVLVERYTRAHHAAVEASGAFEFWGPPEMPELVVVHGGATGADALAHQWALWRQAEGWRVEVEPHPAAWRRADGSIDRGAGMRRNAEMVATLRPGVDVVLSFPGGPGTAHATQLALNRGIRVGCPIREHDAAPWEIRWFGGPGSVVGPGFDGRAGKGRAA